jgi:hypothetical protein
MRQDLVIANRCFRPGRQYTLLISLLGVSGPAGEMPGSSGIQNTTTRPLPGILGWGGIGCPIPEPVDGPQKTP